jgi:hypothetical protein
VATGDFTLSWDTSNIGNGLGNPANGPYAFVGQTRAPKINEMGVWVNQVTGSSYLYKIKVELYLPPNYGLNQIDLIGGNFGMYIDEFTEVGLIPPTYTNPPYNPAGDAAYTFRFADTTLSGPGQMTISNSGLLNAGNYVTIGYYPSLTPNGTSLAVGGRLDGLRVSLFMFSGTTTSSAHTKVDFAPLLGNYTNTIYYAQDPAGTSEANNSSVEVDDPRINTFGGVSGLNGDWKQNNKNTYNAVNSRYSVGNVASSVTPQPPTGGPQLDTDINGNISAASLYMPPPAGQTFTRADGSVDDNRLGMVTSVGELGYIDAGMESTAKQGLPWRTLRLQTSSLDNTVVPDWALMDLFTVPSTVSSSATQMVTPYGTSYGGRVNLNSQAVPFNMARTLPLSAVLLGASTNTTGTVSATAAPLLASNIYYRVYSPLNTATGAYGKQYGYATAYDSPGEVIEAQGIGDQGEAGEALVRDIANLITARGNVFSVYTVGQSLKQNPSGTLSVTGEQRLQAMVERYLSTSGVIKFRTVFFRNLTP